MSAWEIARCGVDDTVMIANLGADGWEPFAVERGQVWFKRRVED